MIEVSLIPFPSVSVTEADGFVTICAQVTSPPEGDALDVDFTVVFFTKDGTAVSPGKSSDHMKHSHRII